MLTKNLLFWLLMNEEPEIDWKAITQDPLVVPSSVLLPQLLRTYQESQRHLAVVVDEYGSFEGIVTLEDVLEEIVGDIRDESDLPAKDILRRSDETLVVRERWICASSPPGSEFPGSRTWEYPPSAVSSPRCWSVYR